MFPQSLFTIALAIALLGEIPYLRSSEPVSPDIHDGGGNIVYDASAGPVNGWSHIVTNPDAFPLIAREVDRYAIDDSSLVEDDEIEGLRVFRTILVKKTSDWQQQHANGIEPTFYETPLRVGDLESVTVWLKLNSSESTIPSAAELASHYRSYLSGEQLDELDRGLPCLGLTFAEAGFNEHETESLNAIYYLSFDPATDFDRWLEVKIPLDDFAFGFEKNYAMRPVQREDVADHDFVAFRINPETRFAKVARNFMNDDWDATVPELYKELSISLSRIEIEKKDSEE